MASPSLVNSWEQPTITPLPEPRRSPRLSNPKSAAAATPASDNKENAARQRKSATPVGGSLLKRGLEARASPTPTKEDELPDEMNIEASDSPAYKKSHHVEVPSSIFRNEGTMNT